MMQLAFNAFGEIVVDLFAGGGGTSTGIEQALGVSPDVAINHDADALAMHEANHPSTLHLREDVRLAKPRKVCGGRPVGLLWLSPDCKHFSKAKGGKPRDKTIRSLAWVAAHWAAAVQPRVIILENVEEFLGWGPLVDGQPCPHRKGDDFRRFTARLRELGYAVEHRELRACDYGAPTIRKRFFLIARRDGKPIVWPKPTHGKPDSIEVRRRQRQAWRTATECIDWTLPCHSIFLTREQGRAFGVKRPLADATMRRIAKGVQRFVIDAAKPFVVPLTHQGDSRIYDLAEPFRTVTGANRGELAMVAPVLTEHANASSPRCMPANEPLRTILAQTKGGHHALIAGFLTKYRADSAGSAAGVPFPTVTANGESDRPGGNPPLAVVGVHLVPEHFRISCNCGAEFIGPLDRPCPDCRQIVSGYTDVLTAAHLEQANGGFYDGDGRAVDAPASTITSTGAQQRLVATSLVKLRGTSSAADPREPLHTVSAQGFHHAEVRAFLVKFYSEGGQHQACSEPMHTITTRDRLGLVTVDGTDYAIADIGLRMLAPRELFRAQGFPEHYVIDQGANGRRLPKDAQVRMCGNSVCPPLARALVAANFAERQCAKERAA